MMIVVYLSKQEALDADSKAIKQINFTENLEQQATIFFIIEETKETVRSSCKIIVILFFALI